MAFQSHIAMTVLFKIPIWDDFFEQTFFVSRCVPLYEARLHYIISSRLGVEDFACNLPLAVCSCIKSFTLCLIPNVLKFQKKVEGIYSKATNCG